jgi:RNA polymerase sigma-70 factor (ECF subfamily)
VTVTSSKARPSARPTEALPKVGMHDFEAIFLEHWPHVYGVLLRLVGDHAEAEDLALETFWRLYDRPPGAQAQLNLGGWLYRVATNLGLNAIRSWKRREGYEIEAGRGEAEENSKGDPEAAAAQAEDRRRARLVLRDMDQRQAQLLILRHSGLAYKDLATALGLSVNSIGTLLLRAEREFEKRYRRLAGEE